MASSKKINNPPVGVKIISVLYYIVAAILVILGIVAMFVPISFIFPIPLITSQALLMILGLFIIGFGVLSFFIARGLWKGKNWARWIIIVFSGIGIINDIAGFVPEGYSLSLLVDFIINAVFLVYLGFNSKVKAFFSKR